MNDLRLFYATERRLEGLKGPVDLVTFDSNMNKLYGSDHEKLYEIDSTSLQVDQVLDLSSEGYSNTTDNQLVLLQFLTESNNVSFVNSKGDLHLLNVLSKEVEGVGSITDGLSGAQWSPDQELLVLVSKSNVLVVMTKDFDILVETKLSLRNQAEAEFVNVGWGSYATQFKGSEGKKTVKEKVEEEKCLSWDDRRARICWRSDGENFVVHFVDDSQGAASRKFQVFNREGVLFSTIENGINVLDSPVTWKYSKALIASSIYRLNKHEIIFFERNGLAHGGFELPFASGEMKVKSLSWNLDSSVLCVWSERVQESKDDAQVDSIVQLWTTANYFWYLKQSFSFKASNKISSVAWDIEDSYTLHLFTRQGQYLRYKLGWTINVCSPQAIDYNGSVAVVNHKTAMITPFKLKIIPPPMCLHRLEGSSQINQTVWSHSSMDVLLLLSDNTLVLNRYVKKEQDGKKSDSFEYVTEGRLQLDIQGLKDYSSSVHHVLWPNLSQLILIADTAEGYKMIEYEISRQDGLKLIQKNAHLLESAVLNVSFNRQTGHLALQAPNGEVLKYNDLDSFICVDRFKFPQPCPSFTMISAPQAKSEEHYIGLTQFFRLYVNKNEISNNCSSFSVHEEYLLFTDHSNTLKFVDLNKLKSSTKKLHEEAVRPIERGGKLVIAVHSDTACILQMPRGNLEAIHPRTLLISKLKSNIDNIKYLSAVELMRKHRVNMNILYDHNPKGFLDHLSEFVSQLNDAGLINLFLTELSDEDTTLTFYKDHYADRVASQPKDKNANLVKGQKAASKKTREICTGLIEICQKVDAKRFFLVILSCYAKIKELDKALYKIIESKTAGDNSASVDDGLRHLLYIVDVNELFDVALGTYDFDVVLMVAEKSQKDPKEYLPFLNELKKLEENYRKYKIDLYLKRYGKALGHIIKCGQERHEEALKLTDEQKLYSEALKYFKSGDEIFKKISQMFANHLAEKKYYEEAALLLYRAGIYEDALDKCLKSSAWQMYLNILAKLKLPPSVNVEKINAMIERLKSENKHLEVANIYEHYLNDPEEALLSLISGMHWFEAITCSHKYGRYDLIETNLLPSLKTSQNDLLHSIENFETKFNELKGRLEDVRAEKQRKFNLELENDLEDEFRNNDDMSVSEMSATTFDNQSSVGSTRSAASTVNTSFSNKSSKRRKQKKSLISLKKGSIYEDLALVQEISDVITYVYNLSPSVSSTSKALLLYNLNDMCIDLQTRYEAVLDLIELNISSIWNNAAGGDEQLDEEKSRFLPASQKVNTEFDKLDAKYRHPPETQFNKRSWKLHFYN